MKIGDFEVQVSSARVGGGWQAVGILPDGKKIISGPSSNREDAELDVKQQAEARLYPQRRYDVNRPFESMLSEEKFLKGAINPEHKGYCTPMSKSTCTPRRKALARRFKKGGDLHHESRKFPELSESEEAIVMHQANSLLEAIEPHLRYNIGMDGRSLGAEEIIETCPYCHGPARMRGTKHGMDYYFCDHCNESFTKTPGASNNGAPPAKASFYPSDGGSAGGGGGITSA